MSKFGGNGIRTRFMGYDRAYVDELLKEKDRLIDLQERDMASLKREVSYLKDKLNYKNEKKEL